MDYLVVCNFAIAEYDIMPNLEKNIFNVMYDI